MHDSPHIWQTWKSMSKGKLLAQNHASVECRTELGLLTLFCWPSIVLGNTTWRTTSGNKCLKSSTKNLAHSHMVNVGFWFKYSAAVEPLRLAVDPLAYIGPQPSKLPRLDPEPEVLIFVLASQGAFNPYWKNIRKPSWRCNEFNFLNLFFSICAF